MSWFVCCFPWINYLKFHVTDDLWSSFNHLITCSNHLNMKQILYMKHFFACKNISTVYILTCILQFFCEFQGMFPLWQRIWRRQQRSSFHVLCWKGGGYRGIHVSATTLYPERNYKLLTYLVYLITFTTMGIFLLTF